MRDEQNGSTAQAITLVSVSGLIGFLTRNWSGKFRFKSTPFAFSRPYTPMHDLCPSAFAKPSGFMDGIT